MITVLFNILIFLFVLSMLIFFHELGHFLAAKACGIYVDRFSIGMPPRIFGLRLGETDYCVGALPIGGYVKMAGQEDVPMDDEEREQEYGDLPPDRWFNKKPVWQRFIVLFAGPFMNLVLALVLYTILVAVDAEVPEMQTSARIGEVQADGAAATAPLYRYRENTSREDYSGKADATGWLPGDTVVSLDGQEMTQYTDIFFGAVIGGVEREQEAVIDRTNLDGSVTRFISFVTPTQFGDIEHPRFGVAPFDTPIIGKVTEGSPAEASGLLKDDIITAANGRIVDKMTFIELTSKLEEGSVLDVTVRREGKPVEVSLRPRTEGRLDVVIHRDKTPLLVLGVDKEYGEKTGIQREDQILEINGQPATQELFTQLQRENPGGNLEVKVHRPQILFGFVQKAEDLTLSLPTKPVRAIGISFDTLMVTRAIPVSQWLPEAFRRAYTDLRQTIDTLTALISGSVSPKMIGGPVMIFNVTTKAAQLGILWLLGITALISINLAVVNLLPLPVLDGGQILINLYEGVRGKPMAARWQERFQMVGLMLIVSLMLFVTWNDISRWFTALKP